jgi:hypothetical protein
MIRCKATLSFPSAFSVIQMLVGVTPTLFEAPRLPPRPPRLRVSLHPTLKNPIVLAPRSLTSFAPWRVVSVFFDRTMKDKL